MATLTPERRRILVVDDDVRTTRIFVRMLREDGFDVEVAHDGATAIGRLSRVTIPDVLVTDVLMPHADGFAVAQYARSRKPLLPIFMVTGYPERITLRVKTLDPAPHVFTKPLDYAALARELSAAI
jgi:CheY-like chemotaxis protein